MNDLQIFVYSGEQLRTSSGMTACGGCCGMFAGC